MSADSPPSALPATATSTEDSRPSATRRIAGEALPPELSHLVDGAFGAALGRAIDYAQRSVSPRTARQYAADWHAFRAWCGGHRAPCLPAPPAVVAAYLADRSATRGRSGLRLILAALAHHHRRAGHPWTSGDPVIASVMRGILREQKRPVRPAAALCSAELRRLLAGCGEDLAGLRDRALLLLGFAGALRRSELVALDHEDVRVAKDGLVLRIRSSKGDQEGQGAEVGIARGAHPGTCPVRALQAWLRRAGIQYGPVFRRLTAAGTIEGRLTGNGVWRILRARARGAGLEADPGERLSPHGLRAGFITEAYLHGALDEQAAASRPRRTPARPASTPPGATAAAPSSLPPARPGCSTSEAGWHARRPLHARRAAGRRTSRVARTWVADAATPAPAVVQAIRTEIGRPSSSIRLSAWTATSTSVARCWSVRERSPSPITCLNLLMAASARARFV